MLLLTGRLQGDSNFVAVEQAVRGSRSSETHQMPLLIRKPEPEREEGKLVRDPLFLFACHLECQDKGNLKAYQELIAALDEADEGLAGKVVNLGPEKPGE